MDKREQLRKALQDALKAFDAHDMEVDEFGAFSVNCDGTEDKFCDCFDRAMKKVLDLYDPK